MGKKPKHEGQERHSWICSTKHQERKRESVGEYSFSRTQERVGGGDKSKENSTLSLGRKPPNAIVGGGTRTNNHKEKKAGSTPLEKRKVRFSECWGGREQAGKENSRADSDIGIKKKKRLKEAKS